MTIDDDDDAGGTRIAKWLAHAGIASRRASEELVRAGRVEVNGAAVTDLAFRVPDGAEVRLDGSRIQTERPVYVILHKPKGVLCTNTPQERRPRAIDLVDTRERLYPVGRLDEESEGLLLMTNDGELAHHLTHPSFQIAKRYLAKVRGRVERQALDQIRDGVHLAEGKTASVEVYVKKRGVHQTTLELVLREGINREIRRVLAKVGHGVVSLKRTGFGPLQLGKLPVGAYRYLSPGEIIQLKRAVAGGPVEGPRPHRARRPSGSKKPLPASKKKIGGAKKKTRGARRPHGGRP